MIKLGLVLAKIDLIRTSSRRLAELVDLGEHGFLADPDNFAIAEHHLRRALEAVFDIGRHIMAKQGFGYPKDYRSIITVLGHQDIIPQTFAEQIRGMAGYRNRLVHGYAEVTPQEMYSLLQKRLTDLDCFCKYILEYLDRHKT